MFERKFNIILGIFLLLFASIAYLSLSQNRLPFLTRASNKDLDINKSLVIISKLEALANNQDHSTITVFARNSAGVGLENNRVSVTSSLGNFDTNSALSDNYGKAVFSLKSALTGTAKLQITIENQLLPSNYDIQFINP